MVGKHRKTKIGTRIVESLLPGEVVMDTEASGFGVRRQEEARVYFVRKFAQGRRHFETIGEHGREGWTPTTARDRALTLIQAIKGGHSPGDQRERDRSLPTVAELAEDFMASHVKAKRKARTAEGYNCIIELHIKPTIGRIRVDGLTQTHISRLHGSLASTPYQANRVLAVLSKMLGWAEQHGYRQRGTNPCRDIDRFMEARRERFLSTEELARLGKALFDMETEGSESLFATAAVQLLLFTGARLSEVLTLRWEWVDLQRGLLFLPTSKTGRKTIRLNASAAEILTSLPRVENNPYVIVGHREGQHLVNLSKAWRRILNRAELHGVRLHDLRHTFASTGAAVSGSLPMIGKLMGHTNVATTARYAHLTVDPVQLLNEEIGRTMAAALGRQMREKENATQSSETPDSVVS